MTEPMSFLQAGAQTGPGGEVRMGEVRFEHPASVEQALMMDGSLMLGQQISVAMDPTSKDGTKIIIQGFGPEVQWQELKDHFKPCGMVAHADVKGSGKGGGGGKWMGGPQAAAQPVPGGVPGGERLGEVRFEHPASVEQALMMDGSLMLGQQISIMMDPNSKDGTKILIKGFGPEVQWQELKDHFKPCGMVAHADVKGSGKGGGGWKDNAPSVGQIRFSTPEEAEKAVQMLNCSQMLGSTIEVKLHSGSKDGTKVHISGIPPGAKWQELKDHFGQIGKVEHAETWSTAPGQQVWGEVRFEDAGQAQLALKTLNGSMIGPCQIFIQLDQKSTDQTKLTVTGISPGTDWQELKDHFSSMGTVAFADVKGCGKGSGKLMGAGKGPGPMMAAFPAFNGKTGGKTGGANPFNSKGQMAGNQFAGSKGSTLQGEVRYEHPGFAQMAVSMLNGSVLGGAKIQVDNDWGSQDGTKLWIAGLPPSVQWQELKDHFGQCGAVAYANVKTPKGKGKGASPMGA